MKKTNKLQESELLRKCEYCKKEFKPYFKKPNAKTPSYSLFKCNECGIELNADYNAAFNIAQKGLKTLSN